MAYWLFKSEPNTWSWDNHLKASVECWDGVRNYQAAGNMKKMKIGDKAYFYHSVHEKKIVGIVEVVKEYYPDHTDETGRFGMVDLKAVQTFTNPVTLQQIKEDPRLENLALVRQSRLSVMPIDDVSWSIINQLGKPKDITQ